MAWVSCFPCTEGTATMGMFGPPLTTRSTAEFFPTDAPALGSVDRTLPLVVVLVLHRGAAHGEVVVVEGLRGLAGGQADDVGHGHVAAEDPQGAQEEEGDDGQGHQEHDQQDDQVACALLALEVLLAGGRPGGRDGHGPARRHRHGLGRRRPRSSPR